MSVSLANDLQDKGIFCAGTIHKNKLHATPEFLDKGTLHTMERGDYLFRTKGNVAITLWKDKDIHLISNAYPVFGETTVPIKLKVDGLIEQVPCPSVLTGYNQFMGGGVDQNDQKKSYYAIRRSWQ